MFSSIWRSDNLIVVFFFFCSITFELYDVATWLLSQFLSDRANSRFSKVTWEILTVKNTRHSKSRCMVLFYSRQAFLHLTPTHSMVTFSESQHLWQKRNLQSGRCHSLKSASVIMRFLQIHLWSPSFTVSHLRASFMTGSQFLLIPKFYHSLHSTVSNMHGNRPKQGLPSDRVTSLWGTFLFFFFKRSRIWSIWNLVSYASALPWRALTWHW